MGKMMKGMLKSLLVAYAVTAVVLMTLAFVLLKFQPDSRKMGIAILACYVISCLTGGWLCGKKAEKRKFLWGLATGIVYFLMLFAVSCMGERTLPLQVMQVLTVFVLCAGSGMAGGMISP